MVTFFDAKFDKSLIVVPREAGVSIGLDYYTTQSRALVENIHLAPKVLIAIRLLNLFIQLVYLYFHNFTAIFPFKNTSFFKLVNIFCITLAIRSLYWILLVIVAGQLDITLLFALGLDISLYLDIAGDQFGHCMMFLLAFNRLTSMKMIRLHFPRNNWELLFVVSVVVALTVGSTLLYIEYSDTRRNFVREIGFIDLAQQKGYNLFINRFYYIFPIGATLCYFYLFCHVRQERKSRIHPVTISNAEIAERNVFSQLIITIFSYLMIAVSFEYVNHDGFWQNYRDKVTFVSIVNICNNVPELLFPAVLLLLNAKFRKCFTSNPILQNVVSSRAH